MFLFAFDQKMHLLSHSYRHQSHDRFGIDLETSCHILTVISAFIFWQTLQKVINCPVVIKRIFLCTIIGQPSASLFFLMSSLHNIVQFEKCLFEMSDMSFEHISCFFILHTT